jgi:polyisoprenoid-binding protein YceI
MSVIEKTEPIVPTGEWKIDPAHTSVEFAVKHMGLATVKGYGRTFEGQRDGHLQTPDFFDAERHPQLRLVSTQVGIEGEQLAVKAELTIKGVTRPIELHGRLTGTGTDPWGGERLGLDLEGTLDRSEFGLSWNAPLPGGGFLLADEVRIALSISAVKAA